MGSDITLMDFASGSDAWHKLTATQSQPYKSAIFRKNPEYIIKSRYFNQVVSSTFASLFNTLSFLRQTSLDVVSFTTSSAQKKAGTSSASIVTGAVESPNAPLGSVDITLYQAASGQEIQSDWFSAGGNDLPQTGTISIQSGSARAINIEFNSASARNDDILSEVVSRIRDVDDSPIWAQVSSDAGNVALKLVGKETGLSAIVQAEDKVNNLIGTLFPAAPPFDDYVVAESKDAEVQVNDNDVESYPSNTLYIDFQWNLAWSGPIRLNLNPHYNPPDEYGDTATVTVGYADQAAAGQVEDLSSQYNSAQSVLSEHTGIKGTRSKLEQLADTMDRFITAYNSINTFKQWKDLVSGTPRTIQSGLSGVYINNRSAMKEIGIEENVDGKLELNRDKFLARFQDEDTAESALDAVFNFAGSIYSFTNRIMQPVFDRVRVSGESTTYIVGKQYNVQGLPASSLSQLIPGGQVFNNRFSGFFLNLLT